jgi:DNA-binding transcriptional ArsR family regulator
VTKWSRIINAMERGSGNGNGDGDGNGAADEGSMDSVFKALADPTRRSLLDELFEEDGQSLSALEERLPMTRFGVMKHLRVLEQAGLVVARKRGREKLHYLNPVPIRLIHDRWVSKYAEPWAAGLSGLKTDLEAEEWKP